MDLKKLEDFIQIYKSRSLSEASRKRHLSKPALSLSLKGLESHLGVNLFTRSHKAMLPTAAGEKLFSRALSLVSEIKEIESEIRDRNEDFQGAVRIGAPLCFSDDVLLPFFSQYQEKHSKILLDLHASSGQEVYELFLSGKLDFAIIGADYAKRVKGSFTCEPLAMYKLTLVCSPSFFQKQIGREPITAEKLISLAWASQKHVSEKDWFEKNFGEFPRLEQSQIFNNHHLQMKSLLEGKALGLQADYSVRKYLENGRLVNVIKNEVPSQYRFYSVQHFNQIPPYYLKHFLKEFRDYIATGASD